MQPKSLKAPKTYRQQIEILKGRGLAIQDEGRAEKWLSTHNYYRFTGYLYHFMENDQIFIPNLQFSYVTHIYDFDRELRILLLSSIEIIEIYLRTQIAYVFSHLHGEEGHYDSNNFLSSAFHADFLKKIEDQISKNKDIQFVAHHNRSYGGKMPLWVMVEIMSLSTLSMFFGNTKPSSQAEIARKIRYRKPDVLKNWLHVLSILRNRCAHYGRIYNTKFTPNVVIGGRLRKQGITDDRLCALLYIMQELMPTNTERNAFIDSVVEIIQKYSGVIDFKCIGLTGGFKDTLTGFLHESDKRDAQIRESRPQYP